jgi:Lon protease-like protein
MGVVSDYRELEEGDLDVLLTGVGRFEILDFVSEEPFQTAKVKLLEEGFAEESNPDLFSKDLIVHFKKLMRGASLDDGDLGVLEEADFQTLVNSICAAVPIGPKDKQFLLELDCLHDRAETILSLMEDLLEQKRFVTEYSHLRPDDPMFN